MSFLSEIKKAGFEHLVVENEPMKKHSSFRAGGKAKYFAEVSDSNELVQLITIATRTNTSFYVIGNGSNVLFADSGFNGLVIKIGTGMNEITVIAKDDESITIEVGSGLLLSTLGNYLSNAGYTGAEFCCGIPGSVGGAIYMNAGAYGGEMRDIVKSVLYFDTDEMCFKKINSDECEFGYRTSAIERNGGIVISATISAMKGDLSTILKYVSELKTRRIASQPLEIPSAGSTFKRPEGHYAGALIEDAGLKGFALDHSGAQISLKHAGFLVNNGGTATATDIYRLIKYVIERVYDNSGVRLEPEVKLIGFK